MENDEEVMDIIASSNAMIDDVCAMLRKSTCMIYNYIANMVASICDVEIDEMMCKKKSVKATHARWFYWYCYRYLTNECYESISERTRDYCFFTTPSIAYAVSKMGLMISEDYLWARRWKTMKRIIKTIQSALNEEKVDAEPITLKITTPQGVNVQLKQEK